MNFLSAGAWFPPSNRGHPRKEVVPLQQHWELPEDKIHIVSITTQCYQGQGDGEQLCGYSRMFSNRNSIVITDATRRIHASSHEAVGFPRTRHRFLSLGSHFYPSDLHLPPPPSFFKKTAPKPNVTWQVEVHREACTRQVFTNGRPADSH